MIPDTINEFPSFSFILGDLHAHVIALPFTVLAIAFAMQVALRGPRGDALWRSVAEALAAALAIGALYAINSWSYPVAAGLLAASVVVWLRTDAARGRTGYAIVWLGAGARRELRAVPAVRAELRPRGARDRRPSRRAARSSSGWATWR